MLISFFFFFFFSSRRRHTRSKRDWSSDVCSSDLDPAPAQRHGPGHAAGQGQDLVRRIGSVTLRGHDHIDQQQDEDRQIGRASCRERVENAEGGGVVKKKEKEREETE